MMVKSLRQAQTDEIEQDMENLIQERYRQPPPPLPVRPLTIEAQKMISKGIMLAAEQLVKEATEAAAKYRDEAQFQYEQVIEWGKACLSEAEKLAGEIAESHAGMLRSAEHFRAAMTNAPPELPSVTEMKAAVNDEHNRA